MQPGSIVSFRERDWILLPSSDDSIYKLRPLTSATDEVLEVHKLISNLIRYSIPYEGISPSKFPLPSLEDISDTAGAYLLWQAARLTLREGAAPFRSLGRISIRPRTYQLVPLLMALRLDPVRLFIADDVGIGKTIEALLIVRELIDRGEIERFAILCPPNLCDQWEKELREKFNLDAVIIRSSTISSLERQKPKEKSIYEYFPYQVISIDWVKSDRKIYQFLEFCPELIIVDEAHGAAESTGRNRAQQLRHRLLKKIAQDERRHLILLTATPHSGIENAFMSLLSLLNPKFGQWDMGNLSESQRIELARHFVQRTRADIMKDWESENCFAKRIGKDESYSLSKEYKELFDATYRFCSELVVSGSDLDAPKRRMRYWGALSLLRCVMSSPAAAIAALEKRTKDSQIEISEEGVEFSNFVFEPSYELAEDETPLPPIEKVKEGLDTSERRKLKKLLKLASELKSPSKDRKLDKCKEIIGSLLTDGFNPIIWCRYVATAEYVASELQKSLGKDIQVTAITGRLGQEERHMQVDAIDPSKPRVLVATDCLSEGINLQEKFNAVIHYDLPWNPNRLEQREGRVDRFGQRAKEVVAVRFYGRDNAIDGAVLEVLLNKARQIYKALGTYVPVPEESENVMEALLNSLFLRKNKESDESLIHKGFVQKRLFTQEENEKIYRFHKEWDKEVNRERINRTRFAQRALKPHEVNKELDAADSVLGDPKAVEEFVLNAAQRINLDIHPDPKKDKVYKIAVSIQSTYFVPEVIRHELPKCKNGFWRISFYSPTPEGAEYLGRNHRFVHCLASYLLEDALNKKGEAIASRCGVIRTNAVDILTTLFLLRVRYLVEIPERFPMLSEEVMVLGYNFNNAFEINWLEKEKTLNLLTTATPTSNISLVEKKELLKYILDELGDWAEDQTAWGEYNNIQLAIQQKIKARAKELEQSHKRIRKAVSLRIRELKIRPQFPPDLLGILVLQPEVA